MGNRMGAILKPSEQQGSHIWYYRVARSCVDTQTSLPAVIPRVTERRAACNNIILHLNIYYKVLYSYVIHKK